MMTGRLSSNRIPWGPPWGPEADADSSGFGLRPPAGVSSFSTPENAISTSATASPAPPAMTSAI